MSKQMRSYADISKLQEIARMVVAGKKVPEIAEHFGITPKWARHLIRDAKLRGLAGTLYPGQNSPAQLMAERRYTQASVAMDIVQARLDKIKADIDNGVEDSLDARAVNDAFRALDRTEYVGSPKQVIIAQTQFNNNVAISSPEQLKQAKETSDRIMGLEID